MDNIQKILIQKAFKNELAHFYILEPSHADKTENIIAWCRELIKNIYLNKGQSLSDSQIINHQDILHIESPSKRYTLSDFDPFFSFLNYKPDILDRKYIIIEEAHLLSIHVANKLLKSLEEPPIEVCIMLINNKKSTLLETITSRAIKLRLQNSLESKTPVISQANDHLELAQMIKKDQSLEEQYQAYLLELINSKKIDSTQIDAAQDYFTQYNQDILYNNPSISRAFKLFNLIKSLT